MFLPPSRDMVMYIGSLDDGFDSFLLKSAKKPCLGLLNPVLPDLLTLSRCQACFIWIAPACLYSRLPLPTADCRSIPTCVRLWSMGLSLERWRSMFAFVRRRGGHTSRTTTQDGFYHPWWSMLWKTKSNGMCPCVSAVHFRCGLECGPIKLTHMVIIDEQGNDDYAVVPTSFVGTYLHILQEGIIYKLQNFMVSPRPNILNPAAAPFMITFGQFTTVEPQFQAHEQFPEWTYRPTLLRELPAPNDVPEESENKMGPNRQHIWA